MSLAPFWLRFLGEVRQTLWALHRGADLPSSYRRKVFRGRQCLEPQDDRQGPYLS